MKKNSLRKIRESLMLSRTELARKANLSPQTISCIEQGKACQLNTQRKVILALGLKLSDKERVF